MKKFLATTAVVGMMATAANASTVVDLTTGGDVTSLGQMGSFDTVGAQGSIDPWRAGSGADYLTQTAGGLGVWGRGDSSSQLDGFVDEAITFNFDYAVRLVSVTFSYFGRGDDADIYVNGTKVANESSSNPYYFGNVIASSFTIGADGISDSFRIKEFKVAPVPLPAAGFLLLGGLAGLGALSRKRKKTA